MCTSITAPALAYDKLHSVHSALLIMAEHRTAGIKLCSYPCSLLTNDGAAAGSSIHAAGLYTDAAGQRQSARTLRQLQETGSRVVIKVL
jgi:hypothetical protein